MTRKERAFTIETIAFAAAGLCGVFVIPTLISQHETIAFVGGGLLALGWTGWGTYLVYRITREN